MASRVEVRFINQSDFVNANANASALIKIPSLSNHGSWLHWIPQYIV